MADQPGAVSLPDFELAGWRVQPSLNRLTREGTVERLEPKMMDVLVALAARAGRVVPKQELADAVWPNLFVTEAVITRAIAGLRRALGDDAREPRFIETIAKRGYRLLVAPRGGEAGAARPAAAGPTISSPRPTPVRPFAAGQWVRGERFFGRAAILAEVLDGPRNGVWLLGSRAIGKTSALKQLAHLAGEGVVEGYLPLYWDLQGCERPEDLAAGFGEALAEAEQPLGALGIAMAGLAAEDVLTSIARLRRAVRAAGRTLLLLVDEGEALLAVQASAPALLRRLRGALLSQEGVRTVLAGGSGLWRLASADGDTSPFLHGFAPPLYLGALEEDAAAELVRQRQAPSRAGGEAVERVAEALAACGNHPFLLQLLCTRWIELGDLAAAAAAVAADAGVRHLFAVDFELLSPLERAMAVDIAHASEVAPVAASSLPGPAPEVAASLLHLERLGVLRREDGAVRVRGAILAAWLREREP